MGNGTPPAILAHSDREIIKNGTCVTGGAYDGCIKIGDQDYRWIENGGANWELNSGAPTVDQVKITDTIWDKCKASGTLDWSIRGQYWYDGQSKHYRWYGAAGNDVELVEI